MLKTIKIQGMHCKNCAKLVESTVEDIQGIESPKVDLEVQSLSFDYTAALNDQDLVDLINKEIKADNFTASL